MDKESFLSETSIENDERSIYSEPNLRVFQKSYKQTKSNSSTAMEEASLTGRSVQTDLPQLYSPSTSNTLTFIPVSHMQYNQQNTILLPAQYLQPTQENKVYHYDPEEIKRSKDIKSYNILAWFTCLFCCFPLGIGALIFSWKVRKSKRNEMYEEAQNASDVVRFLAILAILLGIAIIAVVVSLQLRFAFQNGKGLFG